jgi:hypothetical protein
MAEAFNPGKRHFVVECVNCGQFISLGEAPTSDEEPHFYSLKAACPHCRFEATYSPEQISRRSGSGHDGNTLLD